MHVTPSKLEYFLKPGRAFGNHDVGISSFRIEGATFTLRDAIWDLSGTVESDDAIHVVGTYRDERQRLNDIVVTLRYDGQRLSGRGPCHVRSSSVKATCTIELMR